jgi:tetratricopeptide (TPR) repeat protein
MNRLGIFLVLWNLVVFQLCANDIEPKAMALMQTGNESYLKGDYSTALAQYTQIDQLGLRSFELLYNTANVYYKQKEFGKAIVWYERCLKYYGSNDDVMHNLALCKKNIIDKDTGIDALSFGKSLQLITDQFNEKQWAYLSIISLFLLCTSVFMLLVQQSPERRKVFFSISLTVGIVFTLIMLFGISKKQHISSQKEAIVLSPSVSIYSEPSNSSKQIFVLHEGTKVTILNQQNGWVNFSISNGNEGWCTENQVAFI